MSLERPDYRSSKDRALYDFLFYQNKGGQPLTEQERRFVNDMYHMEEFDCGLDGDRDYGGNED